MFPNEFSFKENPRGGPSTASTKAVRELGLPSMVNKCELLINVVMYDRPKVLTGLMESVNSFLSRVAWSLQIPGEKVEPNLGCFPCGTRQAHISATHGGRSTVRKTDGSVGIGGRKKRMPGCNDRDRG